jgi:UDP-N-acetylmuramate--alanine ligase
MAAAFALRLGEPGRVVPDLSADLSADLRPNLTSQSRGTRRRAHVVAAGGAAMSAICHILHRMGWTVTGSDEAESAAVDRLRADGMNIRVGHDATSVAGADLVVVSTAVKSGNPELDAALRLGLPIAGRQEMMEALGALRTTLAISGTHGKTTTSAMAATAALHCGLDPSFIVGGVVGALQTGVRWAESEWLVVEADESDNSFLRFNADHTIVTNIEPDHLDFHGDMEHLQAAFDRFVLQGRGTSTVCADDPGCQDLMRRVASAGRTERLHTYGFDPSATYRIVDARTAGLKTSCTIQLHGSPVAELDLVVPGLHNALNATSVFAALHATGIQAERIASGLSSFTGVGRRFEFRGEHAGVTCVDDYAHLPSEVSTVLRAARHGGWGRIVAVFQPHRYTRIRDVGKDFANAFVDADVVFITELYAAGQVPIPGIDSSVVADAVRAAHPSADVRLITGRSALLSALLDELHEGDLCLTMNAGDLTTLPDELLQAMRSTRS